MRPSRIAAVALLAAALAAVGCGSGDSRDDRGLRQVSLVLDYVPNAVHAGIYRAIEVGYYRQEGIDLEVLSPTSTSDPIRLVLAGEADFGLADGLDLGRQVSERRPVEAVMALLRRPAGGIITLRSEGIAGPGDLAGRKVGETGAPSDRAVFETMVEADGGDPAATELVSIGFGGVQALTAGKISAFLGYLPADSTALRQAGRPVREFAFDRFGGPDYPGLVALSGTATIEGNPGLVAGFVRATIRGYRDALADPEAAIAALPESGGSERRRFQAASFEAYRPWFGPADEFGRIDRSGVLGLSGFMVGNGLAARPFGFRRFGTGEFVPGS